MCHAKSWPDAESKGYEKYKKQKMTNYKYNHLTTFFFFFFIMCCFIFYYRCHFNQIEQTKHKTNADKHVLYSISLILRSFTKNFLSPNKYIIFICKYKKIKKNFYKTIRNEQVDNINTQQVVV